MLRFILAALAVLPLFGCGRADRHEATFGENAEAAEAFARGHKYYERKQNGEALAELYTAIRREPTFYDALLARAAVYYDTKDYDNAIVDYSEAIRLSPTSKLSFELRAECWYFKGEFDKAIEDCSEAIRLEPRNSRAHANRGGAWQKKERYDEAIADYSKAIYLGWKPAYIYSDRAHCWHKKGDFAKAIADNEEALRIGPKDHVTLHNLALVLATAPDPKIRDGKRAVEIAKEALGMEKDNARYMAMVATAYAAALDYEEAVRWQEKALEFPPVKGDPQAQLRLERYRRNEPLHPQ